MSQAPTSLGPRFPLSIVTLLGDPLRKRLIGLDASGAMKLAERLAGLDDYGDDDGGFRKRLDETIETMLRTDWNTLGRIALRYSLHWHLTDRLRVVELLKQRPDIEDIGIERPVVITGLFRTGTTFLHNVLAADPNSRVAHTWELMHPVGRRHDLLGDEKWRRERAARELFFQDLAVPEQVEAHAVKTHAYEEDFFLLEHAMAVMTFFIGLGDFEYAIRMLQWDMIGPYRWHKRQLQILWEQRRATRWLLKCPWHLWNLEALLTVYPDALVIQTHRELVGTIGSQCSLTARIAAKFQRNLDLRDVGRFWLDYSSIGLERGLQARARLPRSQVYDVRLEDLRARPVGIIEDIYGRFGLTFDGSLADRLDARIAEDPTAQEGEHAYDIADYGLTEDQIKGTFTEYRRRFGV